MPRRTSQRPLPPGSSSVDACAGDRRAGSRRGRARRRCSPTAARRARRAVARRRGSRGAAGARSSNAKIADVDLLHHRAQQRGRLERAEPLRAQRRRRACSTSRSASAERVVGARAARADREVALAQRGEQVRQRLQRPHDALAQRERDARATRRRRASVERPRDRASSGRRVQQRASSDRTTRRAAPASSASEDATLERAWRCVVRSAAGRSARSARQSHAWRAGGRARCGSGLAPSRPGSRCRRSASSAFWISMRSASSSVSSSKRARRPLRRARRAGARSAARTMSPCARSTARSIACSSSRTLPGHDVIEQRLHRRARRSRERLPVARRVAPRKCVASAGCPRAARAAAAAGSRRVEPEEQVLAEAAAARPRDARSALVAESDAHVDARGRDEPTRSNSPVCSTRRSFACWRERHVRDLVEEERAAVGELEAADAVGLRVGERALHVAEQLALEHALGEPARVDGDERPRRARRRGVQPARDELLAGAVLAGDEHVRVGRRRRARSSCEHRPHARRLGDQRRGTPSRAEQRGSRPRAAAPRRSARPSSTCVRSVATRRALSHGFST